MSDVVAVLGVQHNPLLYRVLADPIDPAATDLIEIRDAFTAAADRLRETRPDVLVVIATDHLTQWFYENMPSFLIGKAADIPATFANEEREFGLPTRTLHGDVDLASWLLYDGLRRGVDFAASDEFRADHSVLVPLHFLTPRLDVPVVVVFTNCIAPPLPSAQRFYAVGEALREAIDACPLPRRVAVIASGHLATEVGGPRHFAGSPDLDFDRDAVAMVAAGAVDSLTRLATFERLTAAGNVSHQFLNFVLAMGVAGGRPAVHAQAVYSRFATSPFFEWPVDAGIGDGGPVTRYVVNKVMRLVIMNDRTLAAYRADPAAFVAGYSTEHPADAAVLTAAERDALDQRDYGALYRLGAHPYLLWSFSEAVWVPDVSRPELVESFRSAAATVGYPDWATTAEPGRASGVVESSADRVEGANG